MKSRSIKGGSLEEIRIALDQISSVEDQTFTSGLPLYLLSSSKIGKQ
jgi:hypothetical protein